MEFWMGLIAPADTSEAIIEAFNAELQRALANPEVKERLQPLGMKVQPGTSSEFARTIQNEVMRWRRALTSSHGR